MKQCIHIHVRVFLRFSPSCRLFFLPSLPLSSQKDRSGDIYSEGDGENDGPPSKKKRRLGTTVFLHSQLLTKKANNVL